MSGKKRKSFSDRLLEGSVNRAIGKVVDKGVDKLPIGDFGKIAFREKAGDVVRLAGETATAVVNGAAVMGKGASEAARDGAVKFKETREQAASRGPAVLPRPVKPELPSARQPQEPLARRDASDVMARLRDAAQMHADGVLTDEEFQALKAKVLDTA